MTQAGIGPRLARAADILARDMMCIADGESVLVTADTGTDILASPRRCRTPPTGSAPRSPRSCWRLRCRSRAGWPTTTCPTTSRRRPGACDAWIDLCMPYLAGSGAFDDAMEKRRVRYFLGADMGAEGIVRLMGGADLDAMFALGVRSAI